MRALIPGWRSLRRTRLSAWLAAVVVVVSQAGCHGASICSRLEPVECSDQSRLPCGCYQIEKMAGGIEGGEHPLPPELVHQAILVRGNNTIEFYSNDTLKSIKKYTVVRQAASADSVQHFSLLVNDRDEDGSQYAFDIVDRNNLWFGPNNVADAFSFLYVRKR